MRHSSEPKYVTFRTREKTLTAEDAKDAKVVWRNEDAIPREFNRSDAVRWLNAECWLLSASSRASSFIPQVSHYQSVRRGEQLCVPRLLSNHIPSIPCWWHFPLRCG